jgi:hypothetical protein
MVFVCAYARSHVCVRHENVSGSFETPSSFRNVHKLHELSWVRKVVTRSLNRFLLVNVTYRHMRTKRHKFIWTCLHTQETNRDLRNKVYFWTRLTTSAASIHGCRLWVNETWKSVILSPNRILLFKPWPSRRLSWIKKARVKDKT